LRFFDLDTGKEYRQRRVPRSREGAMEISLGPLAVSGDRELLAGGTVVSRWRLDPPKSACVHLWEFDTGRLVRSFEAGRGEERVQSCALSADGRLLAAVILEQRPERGLGGRADPFRIETVPHLRVWEVAGGKEVFHRQSGPPWVAFF